MTTYVALLRGINVGGHNLLPMKALKELLESMGCRNLNSYIQSGNVVFQHEMSDTEEFSGRIGSKIKENHGFEPKIVLLEKNEFQNAAANNPFPVTDGKTLHIFFLDTCPEKPDMDKLNALKSASESFLLVDKVFYFFAPEGIGRSKLATNIERCLGVPATGRNWNTIQKLLSMLK